MYQTLIILIFVSLSSVSATITSACPPKNNETIPTPIHVEVIGCEAQPCPLYKGTDVIMIMNFTAPEALEKLQAKVLVRTDFLPIDIPYPIPEPNVCNALTNTHCPLEINEPGVYRLQMPIHKEYPELGLNLKFSILKNDEKEAMVCFSIRCEVKTQEIYNE